MLADEADAQPDKDYRRYLAIAGALLRRRALDAKARAAGRDPLRAGVLLGWAEALDVLRGCLEPLGLCPADLTWEDFVPRRNLLGFPVSPKPRPAGDDTRGRRQSPGGRGRPD